MDGLSNNITIGVEEYKEMVTIRSDYDCIYSIASHLDDEKSAMQAIKIILGIWSDANENQSFKVGAV